MNFKELNIKQFLLEKGEQVGLGIALTLMVLMLIFSLFMPSKGFFSGSPAAKAEPLTAGAKKLQNDLNSRPLPEDRKPPETKGRMIPLDTELLQPQFYRMTSYLFPPAAPENPNRQPPEIFNLVEARGAAIHVDIDTYILGRGNETIYVLRDRDAKSTGNNPGAGGNNPFARMMRGGMPPMPGGSGPGSGPGNMMASMRRRFNGLNAASGAVQGTDGKDEYEVVPLRIENVTMSEHFARQLQPARMVLIAGAFPFKDQLLEFQRKLRLKSIQDVLDESMKMEVETKDGKKSEETVGSFRFLGVDVQRTEVDAAGKTVQPWAKLDVKTPYRLWLINSIHFQPDDPKYDLVKPMDHLVMPLLREFQEKSQQTQIQTMFRGMMPPGGPGGGFPGRPGMNEEAPEKPKESKYPDLAKELRSINGTLEKLQGVAPKQIARPPAKFRQHENFDPFSSSRPMMQPEGQTEQPDKDAKPGDTIPEYCLVRVVDLSIEPGKFYRYRFKVRMANPNYGNDDVASTVYKKNKDLESGKWVELKETLAIPPETIYYVVDQKQLNKKDEKPSKQSPEWSTWNLQPSRGKQVVFQLHRWVESTPIAKNGDPVPIGEWAIAERVFVGRGEFIGRPVKVDLPVWKYSQDSFVLPAEDQSRKAQLRGKTGVTVNFGLDNSDNQTILIDFAGGSDSLGKLTDNSAVEVLMLTPDGKLRSRNSAADSVDEERVARLEKTRQRIKELREGKAGGGASGAGGLDPTRGR